MYINGTMNSNYSASTPNTMSSSSPVSSSSLLNYSTNQGNNNNMHNQNNLANSSSSCSSTSSSISNPANTSPNNSLLFANGSNNQNPLSHHFQAAASCGRCSRCCCKFICFYYKFIWARNIFLKKFQFCLHLAKLIKNKLPSLI